MKQGYTLIELLVFIVIMGIVALTILMASNQVFKNLPVAKNHLRAVQKASGCMEWFLGQRYHKDVGFAKLKNEPPSTFCSSDSEYTIHTSVSEIAADYKKITVTVSGLGQATLSLIVADY